MIKSLKLLAISLFAVCGMSFAFAGSANAYEFFEDACKNAADATVCQEAEKTQTQDDNSIYGPNGIIGKIAGLLSLAIGVASVIILIIAGINYMLSTGDPTKTNNAKNTILYAIAGILIALVSQLVLRVVIGQIF